MSFADKVFIEYINQVLSCPTSAQLDISQLDREDQELGKCICMLGEKMKSMTQQIEQIVTQHETEVDTSVRHHSFDYMVEELKRRTSALENERNLFVRFTENASERIIVLDEETGDMLFANKVARDFFEETMDYIDDAGLLNEQSGCTSINSYSKWIHKVVHPSNEEDIIEYYQVHSLYIIWEGRGAIAHMFSNITEFQNIQESVKKDALTGAYSRGYVMDAINHLYKTGTSFSLAFVDVDYLKFCNDTFGHIAGDMYLVQVVKMLQMLGEDIIVSRTGGDEFMVVDENRDEEDLKRALEHVREDLCKEKFAPKYKIHKSFSYGVASYHRKNDVDLQQLLADADERMYQNKLENKKKNHLKYKDQRL